jgi:hypothetical protein
MPFPFQSPAGGTRTTGRRFPTGPGLAKVAGRLGTGTRGGTAFFRNPELDAGTTRFGEPDRDGLLRRASAVLPFTDVVHFFSDKFSRLGAGGLAFTSIFASAFQGSFFRHELTVAKAARRLDRVRAVAVGPRCLRTGNANRRRIST